MKRFVTPGLALAIFLSALAVSSPKPASAQSAGLVSSVLNRLEQNRQSLRSLRASISMEKYNAQLRDADKYYGTVAYLPAAGRNASVRIEWNKPQHEILAVANGQYTLYRVRLNQALTGRAAKEKSSGVLEMMNMSRQQLQARFEPFQEVREETLWGGISTIHLKLVPRGKADFKYAEIWVDSSGMPVQSKVVEKNDDTTTIRLSQIERNARVSSDEFNLKLGSDVKIIKS
jgi:outer membrane lipoprotein-sorting protein